MNVTREQLRYLWCDLERDGWHRQPIYEGWEAKDEFGNPSPDGDWKYTKEGFSIHIYNSAVRGNAALDLSAWGPDKLAVTVNLPYSMDSLRHELQRCHECGAYPVETVRYSFAGRCCKQCRPELAKKYEFPGWTS